MRIEGTIIITPPPRSGRPGPASPRSLPWPPWRPASRGEGERRPRERRLTPRHPAPARGARSRSRRRGRGRAPASGTPCGSGRAARLPDRGRGGARRRRGACAPALGEEDPHDGRGLHNRDDLQPAATAGTGEDIEGEHGVAVAGKPSPLPNSCPIEISSHPASSLLAETGRRRVAVVVPGTEVVCVSVGRALCPPTRRDIQEAKAVVVVAAVAVESAGGR